MERILRPSQKTQLVRRDRKSQKVSPPSPILHCRQWLCPHARPTPTRAPQPGRQPPSAWLPAPRRLAPWLSSAASLLSTSAFLSAPQPRGKRFQLPRLSITLGTISLSLCIIDKEYVDKEWERSKFLKDK